MINIDTDLSGNKLTINFEPTVSRTSRLESGLVTENLEAERPVRNTIDTQLDDIIDEIRDLQKIEPDTYKDVMEQIEYARVLNNIVKTIEMSVQIQMTGIFYTLTIPKK